MSVFHNNALIGAGGGAAAAPGAVATKSLRFNDDDQASLSRTPSSAGNRKTFTYSCWFKRANITRGYLFSVWNSDTDSEVFAVNFSSSHTLNIDLISKTLRITDQVFRDPSAWYHLVLAVDTTQSTASDRLKLYINGSQVTSFSTNVNFSQNDDTGVNGTFAHQIGRYFRNSSTEHPFDGYMADIYMIDGSALTPSSFGAYDDNGVWQAAAYSGTYGTNGFHLLDFENESTIGHDSSGNDNDFTANNLTESVLVPNKGFDCVSYTGNGSSSQSITSLSFQPDFVWIKPLVAGGYVMQDVVRGTGNKVLSSHSTGAEGTETYGQIQSFDSNGFTVEAGSTSAENSNHSGRDYIAWCWKAGGAASSNTDGSITSSVSASSTYGFSIVSWTGTGANATVGHGLSSAPKWVIVKNRSATASWAVWHTALSGSEFFGLNTTNAIQSSSAYWNSSTPTASVINVGTDSSANGSSNNMIAYCWEEKSGFSKFGSYTGNGSTSGPTVTGLGFKPRFVLIKGDVAGEDWVIVDTVRSPTNPNKKLVSPNSSSQEFTHPGSAYDMDIDDDGFTVKNNNPRWNSNGETYIYAAFGSGSGNPEDLDVLFDVPANGDQTDTGAGGEVSGNYAIMNAAHSNGTVTFSDGNLHVSNSSGWWSHTGTVGVTSGKWYYELQKTSGSYIGVGWRNDATSQGNPSHNANGGGIYFSHNGNKQSSAGNSSYGATWGNDDIIGVAFDRDAGTITFYKNGVSQGQAFTGMTDGTFMPEVQIYQSGARVNFGQRPFAYSAPSNHKAICTANLATPTIADGSTAFDVRSGLTAQFTISDLKFAADLIWGKSTSNNEYWIAANSLDNFANGLKLNETSAEGSGTPVTNVTATGYQSSNNWFTTGRTYVTFNWDAGTSTASNTDGSITSSVRANQSAGFSILTFTNTTSNSTVGHGLNAKPDMIIWKKTSGTSHWPIYHSSLGATKYVYLNLTNAATTGSEFWNDTEPTSSVITTKGEPNSMGSAGDTVMYVFASVAGFSATGLYESNNSTDGPFIFTGFRPAFILFKEVSTSAQPWIIHDSVRNGINQTNQYLMPTNNSAELSDNGIDILSNGWKIRNNNAAWNGTAGQDYIWYAAAENPFQANGGLAR